MMLSTINRNIIYPLYYARSNDQRLARLKQMERNQWLDKQQLYQLQLSELKKIVAYAYQNTVFYKRVLDERGVSPRHIQSLNDIQLLPVLRKDDIQKHALEIVSSQYVLADLVKDASGGSTGEPTNFYKNIESNTVRLADQIRHDQWTGWRLGEKTALLWGAQRDVRKLKNYRANLVNRIVERQIVFDAFDIDDVKISADLQKIAHFRPTKILGYAGALAKYAEHMKDQGLRLKRAPKGIVATAEKLTEEMRESIQIQFGARVLNRYGSREVGLIASECERQNGLHINADNVLVEIVKNGEVVEPGVEGELLVTDFHNWGFPFIRYSLGDVGVASERACRCGRALPLLDRISGRSSDFFTLPSGKKIHGEFFTHLMYGIEGVKKFQFIQQSHDTIDIILVCDTSFSQDSMAAVAESIKTAWKTSVLVNFMYKDSIPVTASGKFRFTISKI